MRRICESGVRDNAMREVPGAGGGEIKERREANHFYRQPLSLLAYYLVQAMPSQTKDLWPLETNDLAQVFSDQGKKFEH